MFKKRRTQIEQTRREKIVIRFRRNATAEIFCGECGERVWHFSVAQAALVLSVPEAEVFRAAERGRLHAAETAAGALFVCGNSVSAAVRNDIFFGGNK